MDFTNIVAVLTWLTGVGSPIVVTYTLSWLVENWAGWAKVPAQIKVILPMIVSVALSFGANELLKAPDAVGKISPWFQVLMSSILAYLASQKAFVSAKTTGYGARFKKEG